ncbi:MAG: ornithine carbamoyltransferase [Candidatus Binatia bacterium]
MKRDLVSIVDLSRKEIEEILALAQRLKAAQKARRAHRLLDGRTLAMVFEKPSLRTRVTFETGMTQLGGHAIYLAPGDIRLGERETVPDIARNLSRWVDLIVARTFSHQSVVELAAHAAVPVVNGLSDWSHPCQALADCFTLLERRKRLSGIVFAFIGDGNNMVHSLMFAAMRLGFEFRLACPEGYEPDIRALEIARDLGSGTVTITRSVADAVRGADVLYTDVWTSMGQETESERRRRDFKGYQLNAGVLALAKRAAVVMHCLPAHRGEEITEDVLEGPQSIVFDQAENRLHVQKAILVWLMKQSGKKPKRKKR